MIKKLNLYIFDYYQEGTLNCKVHRWRYNDVWGGASFLFGIKRKKKCSVIYLLISDLRSEIITRRCFLRRCRWKYYNLLLVHHSSLNHAFKIILHTTQNKKNIEILQDILFHSKFFFWQTKISDVIYGEANINFNHLANFVFLIQNSKFLFRHFF